MVVASFGQDGGNLDEKDKFVYGPSSLERFKQDDDRNRIINFDEIKNHLKIYNNVNTPSLRSIVLCDRNGPRYGCVGWYMYYT